MLDRETVEQIIKETPDDLRGLEIRKLNPKTLCIDRHITPDRRWLMVWLVWATGQDVKVITEKGKIL